MVENLKKIYEKKYKKKYPFEKSQYHQCMPNPQKEDEFITVQWVNRYLTADKGEENESDKLKYRRYNFEPVSSSQESKYIS